MELYDTIKVSKDLIGIYRTSNPNTEEYVFFITDHATFPQSNQIWAHQKVATSTKNLK